MFSGEFSQFDNVGGTGSTYTYFYIPEDFTLTLVAKDTHTLADNTYLGITKNGGQSTGGFTWAIGWAKNITAGDTFTVKSETDGYHYISMYTKNGATLNWILEHYYVMLNLGSEALPYEPHGIKIPIVCDNQTTNIYLGETQSTRVIKKLILTGEENWERQSGQVADYFRIPNMPAIPSKVLCTHYVSPDDNIVYASSVTGIKMQQSATYGVIIACRPPNISSLTLAGFKQFLANEYAAGHPVTVYYVMATPETTILNEPLMKVEDYADSVVYGSNIPTAFGQNDIDVNTQIKPLKLDITYNALRRAKVYKNDRWILNPSIDWSQTLKISDLQSKKIKEMEGEYIGYNIHT